MSRVNLVASLSVVLTGAAALCGVCPAAQAQDAPMTAKLQQMVGQLNDKEQAALYLFLSELKHDGAPAAAAAAPAAAPAMPAPPAAPAAAAPLSPAKINEQALAMVKQWIDAAKAKNLDAMMAVFSDKFSNTQYGDKSGMRDFLKQAMDMGYLDDVKVKMDKAEVQMKDGKASIYPIDIEGSFGSATLEFVAQQENGQWKLVGLDISGV